MNKNILIGVIVAVLAVGVTAFVLNMNNDNMAMQENAMMNEGVTVGGAVMTPDKDILDNAVNSADHTTFVAAIQAADLVNTLKQPGPFTVFAPTDEAFDTLPEGTVEDLLLPENKEQLKGILTNHVVPGAFSTENLTDGMTLETLQGDTITFTQKEGSWYINDTTKIEVSDVVSSNGITHVIDTVLLPN